MWPTMPRARSVSVTRGVAPRPPRGRPIGHMHTRRQLARDRVASVYGPRLLSFLLRESARRALRDDPLRVEQAPFANDVRVGRVADIGARAAVVYGRDCERRKDRLRDDPIEARRNALGVVAE